MSWIPELPLLRRELTELANRRRTYIVRMVGAVAILLIVFTAYQSAIENRSRIGPGITQYLGVGGPIFDFMAPALFAVIQLLMPAFCCACITSEKESNTIGTLLLTRLSPATIIAEKFMSRLVPMLTLLLLTFPVLAYILTLGGVDTDVLIGTLWLLFCECLLFASLAILCSAWFATTVSAFTVSYCLTGMLAILSVALRTRAFVPSFIWLHYLQDQSGFGPEFDSPTAEFIWLVIRETGLTRVTATPLWLVMILKSIPALIATLLCLVLARFILVPRAFPNHASVLLKLFKVVDTFFKELNDRTTGGIVLINDRTPLPEDSPVVWREQYKKSLGKARYLFRVLVVLEGPTLFICMMAATMSAHGVFAGLFFLQAFIWILAVLIIAVKGATLFTSERAQQTLEPLLATPMTAVEMLDQKVSGMKRLLLVVATPILTVNFTYLLLNFSGMSLLSGRALMYSALSLAGTYILLNLTVWSSAGIGLKIQSQTKAVLASFTMISVVVIVPLVICGNYRMDETFRNCVLCCCPASVIIFADSYLHQNSWDVFGRHNRDHTLYWAIGSVILYAVEFIAIRWMVRTVSPRLLGRRESSHGTRNATVRNEHLLLEGVQS